MKATKATATTIIVKPSARKASRIAHDDNAVLNLGIHDHSSQYIFNDTSQLNAHCCFVFNSNCKQVFSALLMNFL
jgi:hypothetical protein